MPPARRAQIAPSLITRIRAVARPGQTEIAMLIAPLIPPQAPLHELFRTVFHLPPAEQTATRDDIVYGISAVGAGGRVTAHHMLESLGWIAGTRLDIRSAPEGVLVACPATPGVAVVTNHGYFRIPFRQRRAAEVLIGDRILLVGFPGSQHIRMYPPAALYEIFGSMPHATQP